MKEQLLQQFGDKIVITEINGKANVVTMRSTAANILHNFYAQSKNDSPDVEKTRLVQAAAK